MTTIVLVESDTSALENLVRSLKVARPEWIIHPAENAKKALQLASSTSIDAMVCENRLEDFSALELFTNIQSVNNQTIRIIHSADQEAEAQLESTRIVHRFLAKPTTAEYLAISIERSLRLRSLLSSETLQRYMKNVNSVPALPSIYNEMTQELASPHSSLIKLGSIVENDAGLCATVLKIVNSAFYGLSQRVESVAQAVTLLGVHLIKNVTLTAKVFSCFKGSHISVKRLTQLNDDAMKIGAIANQFARYAKLPKTTVNHCQLAGMLCNIGDLIATVKTEGDESSEITSAVLGAYLLRQWMMPDAIVEAIAMQNETPAPFVETVSPCMVLHSIRYLVENYTDTTNEELRATCSDYLATYLPAEIVNSWIEAFHAVEQLTSGNAKQAA